MGAGALGGICFGSMSALVMAGSVEPGGDGLGQPAVFYSFGLLGYTLGAGFGVSQVDPHDLFVASMIGSLLGLGAGSGLVAITGIPYFVFACPIASVALAVWLSEASRNRLPKSTSNPPEVPGFTIGLEPSPGGRLSAVVKLGF